MALLEVTGLGKRFGGLIALEEIALSVAAGEIHALIGPNGAGKTTLVNLLTRLLEPTQGAIRFDGHDLLKAGAHEVIRFGLARIFQHMELFPGLSVLENVLVGAHVLGRSGLLGAVLALPSARAERRALAAEARRTLELVDLAALADRPAAVLTGGQGRMLGLARALVSRPKMVLLDELVAGLNTEEREQAAGLVRRLAREHGITVLAIEHDMRFIMGIADRITVLNFGRRIAGGTPEQIRNDRDVIEAYLGRGRYADA